MELVLLSDLGSGCVLGNSGRKVLMFIVFFFLSNFIYCSELWPALYNDFVKSLKDAFFFFFAYSIYISEPKINFLEE